MSKMMKETIEDKRNNERNKRIKKENMNAK